jgi:hypothetical protein
MEKQIRKIAVINYSLDPGPRYVRQGDDSGEDFYHKVLNQEFYEALGNNQILEVSLDGTSGYASSFLDEAFGNLVYDFSLEKVKANVSIISIEEPEWKDMIENESFLEWEQRRKDKREPEKTVDHASWYRYNGTEFQKKVWVQKSK